MDTATPVTGFLALFSYTTLGIASIIFLFPGATSCQIMQGENREDTRTILIKVNVITANTLNTRDRWRNRLSAYKMTS